MQEQVVKMPMLGGLLMFLSLVCHLGVVDSYQVYLRELTIYKTHERGFIDNKPEVYMTCKDSGLDTVPLKNVRKTGVLYSYGEEDVPVAHLDPQTCRDCTLKEEDLITSDDTFGTITICESEFEASGRVRKSVQDEFDAVFECKACVPPPPPAPPKIIYLSSPNLDAIDDGVMNSPIGKRAAKISHSPLFILLLIGLTLFGLIFGGVSYRWYLILRERAEEERLKEFESILGDPDVDFEEMVEQDRKAFNLKFWNHIHWKPKKWIKVSTEDSERGSGHPQQGP